MKKKSWELSPIQWAYTLLLFAVISADTNSGLQLIYIRLKPKIKKVNENEMIFTYRFVQQHNKLVSGKVITSTLWSQIEVVIKTRPQMKWNQFIAFNKLIIELFVQFFVTLTHKAIHILFQFSSDNWTKTEMSHWT